MKLSTQTDIFAKKFGEEKAVEMLAQIGYDAIDLSCFDMTHKDAPTPKNTAEYKAYAKKLKQIAENNGVYFNQAHAPFPSSIFDDDVYNKNIIEQIVRSMEFCAIAGVRNIVVHPKQHLTYSEGDNKKILKDINLEFYNELIPYAKDFGICICTENMWQYDDWKSENRKIVHSTCATAEEFKEYIDMIDSPYLKGCLDVGHAFLVNEDIPTIIKTLGNDLKALHVHDTGYNVHLHRLRYSCVGIDWEKVLEALAEINYDGELTFEADNTLIRMPDEMLIPTAKYMVEMGRYLIKQFDKYKNK